MNAIGVTLGYALAFVLPYTVEDGAMTSTMWRVVFAGPAVIAAVQLLLVLFVFRFDTPKFYQQQGRTAEYNAVMKLIYEQPGLGKSASLTFRLVQGQLRRSREGGKAQWITAARGRACADEAAVVRIRR